MPLLNFKKKFEEVVRTGVKRQTIRAPRKSIIKSGDMLYFYTGLRTKNTKKLGEAMCRSVSSITIGNDFVQINGKSMDNTLKDYFAQADGFDNFQNLYDFLYKTHKQKVFKGILITW